MQNHTSQISQDSQTPQNFSSNPISNTQDSHNSAQNNTQWLSIRASAGSGKTYALTSRYIYLLFLGARASEILCITFTNKARQEMLERISATLAKLTQDSSDLSANSYAQDLVAKGISPQTIHAQSKAIYARFIASHNHIMTFDAFFNMVVKKFSFYAGILSDYEISANLDIGDEAFAKTLDSLNSADFMRLVGFCVANDLKPRELKEMIEGLQTTLKIDSATIPHLKPNPNFAKEVIDEFQSLRDFVLQITEGKKGRGVTDLRKRFLKEVDSNDIFAILDRLNLTQNMQDSLDSLDLDKAFYEGKIQKIKSLFKDYFDAKESEILGQIYDIFVIYERHKNALLKSKNKLNFSDISNICYDLLNHHIDRNFFYFRLDSKINHILVDEFQDTNLRQYEILKPLIDEIKGGVGRIANRSLFFVGDEKQAIYGFRGCDSRIFRAISDRLQMSITSLPTNYRSAKNIVEFVNTSFKGHFKDYESQKPNSDKNGFVAVITKPKDEILPTIRTRIQDLLDKNKHDIAILTRKGKSAKEIYEFLKVEFPSIKISVESDSNTNKEYLIILNALKFAQTRNIFYLKNCEKLNGEALNLNESSANLARFGDDLPFDKIKFSQMEVSQIVHLFIKQFALYGKSALQILEESANFDDLGEFIEYLQSAEIKSSSDSKSDIQIMTIHKSKGLEFGDVIVCELGGGDNSVDMFYSENFGGDKIYYFGNANFRKRRAFCDSNFARIWETKKAQDNTDALNLLYVAFTRAKESLFVIKPDKIRGGDALKLELLDLEDIEIGADILGESTLSVEDFSAEIPKQVDFGKQGEFLNEDSRDFSSKSKLKGIAMHKALELRLAYNTKNADIEAILRNQFGLMLDSQEIAESLKNMENILQNDKICDILQGADCVRCEVSYLDNSLKRKRIDCLVEKNGGAVILDYKSSDVDLEGKKAQVAEYVRYASKHYKSAEGYLCFANGEIMRV